MNKMRILKNDKGVVCAFKEPYTAKEVEEAIKNELIKHSGYHDSNEPTWMTDNLIYVKVRYGNKGEIEKEEKFRLIPS
jgi:hypothetical protein